MTFKQWLIQCNEEDDTIAYIYNRVAIDSEFPDATRFQDVERYVAVKPKLEGLLPAFEYVWKKYESKDEAKNEVKEKAEYGTESNGKTDRAERKNVRS